jgi:uncharacterized protein
MMRPSPFRSRYGPWALVAGASEGLGAEFARQLAARGLHLLLVARREPVLRELAESLHAQHGVEVRCLALDLADLTSLDRIVEAAGLIELGLLIYNAAHSVIGPFLDLPLEAHLRAIDLNCRAPVVLAHSLGKGMCARRRGGIVLMSSMAGLQGSALVAGYAATKAFNWILAEGLWDELREHGVDVLACCAGATRTPNYLSSRPARGSRLAPPLLDPRRVVEETLSALGGRGTVIPGVPNRLAAFVMQRLLPRSQAIRAIGRATRAMYGHPAPLPDGPHGQDGQDGPDGQGGLHYPWERRM